MDDLIDLRRQETTLSSTEKIGVFQPLQRRRPNDGYGLAEYVRPVVYSQSRAPFFQTYTYPTSNTTTKINISTNPENFRLLNKIAHG